MLLRQRNIFLRIMFYCGTFALRMEIIVTYFSLRHNYIISLFDVVTFLMTLEIRYILVRPNYVWKQCYNYVSLLFVIAKFLYYVTITLFTCLMQLRFLMTLESRFILVRSNYVRTLGDKMVIFQLHLFVIKKWQKNT